MNKIQIASEADVLADEYVLTHNGSFGGSRVQDWGQRNSSSGFRSANSFGSGNDTFPSRSKRGSCDQNDVSKICNYCQG